MREIKCVNNENGLTLTFSENKFTPFLLASVDGVYKAENNVYTSENTMIDGSTYQGTSAKMRNIVISLIADPQGNFVYNQSDRDLLYSLFRKGEKGTLYYTENDVTRKIDYYAESISRESKRSRLFTISLLCPNPLFKDEVEHVESMANQLSMFEFIHEFTADGEELAQRSSVRLVNIVNDIAIDNIGLNISITANGNVTNPSITRVESNESLKLGTVENPFYLARGDILNITTAIGNKHVRLTRGGVTTEVNEYLTEDSEFIQLMFGNNNIAYDADGGVDYMVVDIKYSYEYEGA